MAETDDLLAGLEGGETGGESLLDDLLGDQPAADAGGGGPDLGALGDLAGQADQAAKEVKGAGAPGGGALAAATFAEAPAGGIDAAAATEKIEEMLSDVPVKVRVEFGRRKMRIRELLTLGERRVIELDRASSDPVKLYVNDQLIAHGELMVQKDDSFCVRITEIVQARNAKEAAS
ncbi:MAG: FliM/FliN family flagellar motor switch protein [Planctomycetes bacterium]|nr:FliM/FliN family flagellar motor switch protein [Planctomycetota bacterium]